MAETKEFNAAWMHRSANGIGRTTEMLKEILRNGAEMGAGKVNITVQASDHWIYRDVIKYGLEKLVRDHTVDGDVKLRAETALKAIYSSE